MYRLTAVNRLFHVLDTQLHGKPGGKHVRYEGIHPDDAYAYRTMADFLRCAGISLSPYSAEPPTQFTGAIICFGSPVSNPISGLVLDYYEKEQGRPSRGFVRTQQPKFLLPFEFVGDPEWLLAIGASDWLAANRPNWSIFDTTKNVAMIPHIRNDRQGYASDHLIITVVPNVMDLRSYEAGYKIVLFTGTHGIGTRAVRLLFENDRILASLWSECRNVEAWQAVIEIDSATVMQSGLRQHPLSLARNFLWAPVTPDQNQLDTWFRSMRPLSGPCNVWN